MTANPQPKKPFSGEHARQYDRRVVESGWLDPDILFGLAYRHVSPGQTLLDVGIGTGLASILFHRAGLKVVGLDRSDEMLTMCRAKGFADALFEQDVTVAPYPLADGSVDHAVSSGLLHAFADLSVIFSEVGRVMRPGGVFAFTVIRSDAGEPEGWRMEGREGYPSATLYRHPLSWLAETAGRAGFELDRPFHYTSSAIARREMDYQACLARRL